MQSGQGPWWISIAAALAGGTLALIATLATSSVTAIINGKHQKRELNHSRSVEREKLLYDRRVSLYLEVNEMIKTFEQEMIYIRAQAGALQKSASEPDMETTQSLAAILERYQTTIEIISDEEVANRFLMYHTAAARELTAIRRGDLEAHLESHVVGDCNRMIPKRLRLYMELLAAIRREVGSRTHELKG